MRKKKKKIVQNEMEMRIVTPYSYQSNEPIVSVNYTFTLCLCVYVSDGLDGWMDQ